MMILKRIYSNPSGLFEAVNFVEGINFIFGMKDGSTDPKNSLNGIGKSTFLDLIDFCLLGSFQSQHTPRLYLAKGILDKYEIVLEVEIDDVDYEIRRNFTESNEARFGVLGKNLESFSVTSLRQKLFELVFFTSNYQGRLSSKWFRKLIPFFLKIQRPKKDKFIDPVAYMPEAKIAELIMYHFYLLGIDNDIPFRNYDIQLEIKKKEPAIREIKKLVEELYGLKDISQVSTEVSKIRKDISALEKAVEIFSLGSVYSDTELEANDLTGKIKELVYSNFSDRRRIESYEESFKITSELNTKKIKKTYQELNEILALKITKTLNDAIEFRQKLAESRKRYIENEVREIRAKVSSRERLIQELESDRAKLFSFLAAKEAIRDLTEAFHSIGEKRNRLNELEGKTKVYEDLEKEKAELKVVESQLEKEVLDLLSSLRMEIDNIRDVFSEVYNSIYPANKDESNFNITSKPSTDAKISIDVTVPAMYSKGKNQGRTLIYDLTVLLNSIKNNYRTPNFLVHDGIFDGMDKAHFVALCEYLDRLHSLGKKFQYIITLNEEGTLNEKFGQTDYVNPEQIEQRAILILTPTKKLFGKNF